LLSAETITYLFVGNISMPSILRRERETKIKMSYLQANVVSKKPSVKGESDICPDLRKKTLNV
jgi:hypothetical protein